MDRQLKPVVMGAIFTLVAMGFAYALPHAVHLQPMSDDDATGEVVVCTDDEALDECEEEDVLEDVEETDVVEGEGKGEGDEAKSHGQVVRVAAHCDVKGAAHGELVRSIAKNKDATVAQAKAACQDAMAAAKAAGDAKKGGKPDKATSGGKPDKATSGGKPDKATSGGKPDRIGSDKRSDDGPDTDIETASTSGSDVSHGNGKGKGNDK